VHLVGFQGGNDRYGWSMAVRFTEWIRDQVAFDGVGPLVAQLRRDIAQARGCPA
jgi:FAD synthase